MAKGKEKRASGRKKERKAHGVRKREGGGGGMGGGLEESCEGNERKGKLI